MRRLLVTIASCCAVSAALAQDYLFAVPELTMEVFISSDSATHIAYDITFDNQRKAIDVVDIGVPHAGYNLRSATASIGGKPLKNIRRSQFVDPGYEVHLGRYTIPRGAQGTLHTEFDISRMVYADTTRDDYASFQITPTWFGSRYVTGNTRINIVVHLPAGISHDEVLWHKKEFSAKGLAGDDSHVIVGWRFDNARLTQAHRVGLSFPKRGMSGVIEISRWQLLEEWLVRSPQLRFGAAVLVLAGFVLLFFRFTGGTGISVFVLILAGLVWMLFAVPLSVLAALLPLPVLIYLNERKLRKRRTSYLPAIAQVEGGGIKRGLTAQEAAVVLERRLGQVLGLVIFGLLKKGIVRQVTDTPLTVTVDDRFIVPEAHAGADKFFRAAAQEHNTVIHGFEQPFLIELQQHPGKTVAELNFGVAMRQLIERVAGRLSGFDLSDTRDYYQSVVTRATRMAGAIGNIETREQTIDRDLEWLLMGDHLDDVFVHGDYRYSPSWTRGGGWSGSVGGAASAGTPDLGGKPAFGDVAASFAGWSENTMGAMASAIQPGSLSLGDLSASGIVDLSGADRVTGELLSEFFEGIGEGDGGGDWGGGGGGCACAGCACACACAGGGR